MPVENPAWLSGGVAVMSNLTLPYNRIAIIVFAVLVLAGVALLIARTRLGLFVRGVTQNRRMAACMGVNTARIDTYAFALGSGIAGLAGCALSQVGNVGPDLGQSYIVDSFMVVVLGGVGQLAGTVYAGARPGRAEQAARRLAGRGAGQDHGAGVHRHLHPEAAAGHLRDEGPERRSMSACSDDAGAAVRGLLSARSWSAVFAALVVVAVLVPVLNLAVPDGSAFHMSDFCVQLVGKIMCYAICALAMDLIWGYTGILSLGHGLFFALGGYVMGMYLRLSPPSLGSGACWCRLLNLVVPAGSVFHLTDYAVQLVGKIMCYAICALAMDLIWGYTGILSLGHGLFFALGGYAMGMYLMRQIGRDGQYRMPTCPTSWSS